MPVHRERFVRILAILLLCAGGASLWAWPERAPLVVLLGLATTAQPLAGAWRSARGTALRPAIVWACLAVAFGVASQWLASRASLDSGRPLAGYACYFMNLAVLAALISVLNARTPGGGAWAILMVILIVVFLIPWLEAPGIARHAQGGERLHLDAPWTIFYGLLVAAGVTNYLPTRYGPAALWVGAGLVLEYLALTRITWPAATKGMLWSAIPWTLAVAIWTADYRSLRRTLAASHLDRTWIWFRDHWGVVWALRVQERFNRSAEAQQWPFRLGWFGVIPGPQVEPGTAIVIPPAATAVFRGLVRRFADPQRVAEAENAGEPGPQPLPATETTV